MDLWDLTRLLFRRWYVALPILLASVLTAALVGQSVKPDYRSTGNLVLIPAPGPVEPANPKQPTAERPKNPWGDLGLEALGNAAILKVLDQKTLKGLADSGLSDSITVQVTPGRRSSTSRRSATRRRRPRRRSGRSSGCSWRRWRSSRRASACCRRTPSRR